MKRLLLILIAALILATPLLVVDGCQLKDQNQDQNNEPDITIETIVATLQPLQELATLKVGVSGIVTATQEGKYFWQRRSRMVLLVRGYALYSIDLSAAEVEVDGNEVVLSLPPPRVIESWVDVEESVVWERSVHSSAQHVDALDQALWKGAAELIRTAASTPTSTGRAQTLALAEVAALLNKIPGSPIASVVWWPHS